MIKNRRIPFGYMIESGKIIINPNEKDVLVEIFRKSADGESYQSISNYLTALNIKYVEEKKWNKNMVARILQNEIYKGDKDYPPIVPQDIYVGAKNNRKHINYTESQNIKNLKPLLKCSKCGAQLERRHKRNGEERWYCPNNKNHISDKLNDDMILSSVFQLQRNIKESNIYLNEKIEINSDETIRLQNKINISIKSNDLDIKETKIDIMNLASKRYNNLKNHSMYDGDLKKKIENLKTDILETKTIINIAKEIEVSGNTVTVLILKNNQKIIIK